MMPAVQGIRSNFLSHSGTYLPRARLPPLTTKFVKNCIQVGYILHQCPPSFAGALVSEQSLH